MSKPLLKIDKMYAFVMDGDLGEGICAHMVNDQWMPLVGADMERVECLKPIAKALANIYHKPIKLCYFSERVELEVIQPEWINEQ